MKLSKVWFADDIDDLVAQNKILTKALKKIARTYNPDCGVPLSYKHEYMVISIRKIARDVIREVEKMKDEKG